MNKKLNILLLSSITPYQSGNLGLDVIKSLEAAGHRVDLITKYKFDGILPGMYSVYDSYEPKVKLSLRSRLKMRYPFLGYLNPSYFFRKRGKQRMVSKIEEKPPVEADLIINKLDEIGNQYDLVITLFWESMITAETLKHVYNKLQRPIFIQAVDMFPMTGGCFYFWDCRRFLDACGKCPGLSSRDENDQTNKNFLYKKEIYASIKYVYIGNTWMCRWASQSSLFNPAFIRKGSVVVDENVFLNRDKSEAKALFGLPTSAKFIMFAGSVNIAAKRKGFDVLVKSVNDFYSKLPPEAKDQVLLVLAGKKNGHIQKYFKMKVCYVGFMDVSKLALMYAAADLYLSTAVEDAGPSMVNQALMCGTPVVAFEIGVALDMVMTDVTGYRAKYKDVNDYSRGITHIYNLKAEEKIQMGRKCREIALRESSYDSYADRIGQFYSSFS